MIHYHKYTKYTNRTCNECHGQIVYDEHRAEYYCLECGIVTNPGEEYVQAIIH